MATVKEINGIKKFGIKATNGINLNTVKNINDSADVLERAHCWTIKYAAGSADNWLITHTASGFDVANPTAQFAQGYAPSSSWAAFHQGGYGDGGMSAQCFGEDSTGLYWWGSVRYNDVGRCFMHDTGTLVIDGNDDRIETHGVWPNDATMANSRWRAYVTYGGLDKVWIVGKGQKNVESMVVSTDDPEQSNDQIKISVDDGGNWDDATIAAGGTARQMTSVCYDPRRRQFIAVGLHGRILTSAAGDVTSWGPAKQADCSGDAGNTHYGVRTDGYNVVVTGLNVIRVSSSSLDEYETIPTPVSKTSGETYAATNDSYFLWGACPSVVPIP
jgi:hypothetical protein